MNAAANRPSGVARAFLVIGGTATLIGGAAHGDLPEGSGADALQFVADHPAYAEVHLLSIVGVVLWALGVSGWTLDGLSPTTRWLADAGGRVALIGAAVMAVQFSLDGVGLEALAALWSQPGAATDVFESIAQIAPQALIGTALIWVVLLYGLAPTLTGASLVLAGRRILGWTGVLVGTFSVVGGLTLAAGIDLLPDWLLFAGSTITVNLWVVLLGVFPPRKGTR